MVVLLRLLMEREGEVVSRQDLLEKVWGYDVYPTTRTIDNFIVAFRKYFEPDPRHRGISIRSGEWDIASRNNFR
ncbi:MAG: winged helix-turn-helix domain-containing protein [Flavobacteriales bacterium]